MHNEDPVVVEEDVPAAMTRPEERQRWAGLHHGDWVTLCPSEELLGFPAGETES